MEDTLRRNIKRIEDEISRLKAVLLDNSVGYIAIREAKRDLERQQKELDTYKRRLLRVSGG